MESSMGVHRLVCRLNAVTCIHFYCLLCIVGICVARLVPASQQRFLSYGARSKTGPSSAQPGGKHSLSIADKVLDRIALVNVPHSWFTHFYVWSLLSSSFWLYQTASQGSSLRAVSRLVPSEQPQVPVQASILCMMLMLVQSTRRLWESYTFSRESRSQMWIGHYAFGLTFYSTVNVAVWVEGVGSLLKTDLGRSTWPELWNRPGVVLGLLVFAAASVMQYSAHAHLARLHKYSIPGHWLFKKLVAPHYTAECMIYLGLSLIAAPYNHLLNRTLLWVVFLTTVNLGITADDTKKWMMSKFREQMAAIQGKYRLVPGIW